MYRCIGIRRNSLLKRILTQGARISRLSLDGCVIYGWERLLMKGDEHKIKFVDKLKQSGAFLNWWLKHMLFCYTLVNPNDKALTKYKCSTSLV